MELQGRMRHLQQSIGPPIGPDGRPMMMGPNGPMPRPPPNHPIMMEMQALDQHLRGLHQQPQSPETQQKVRRDHYHLSAAHSLLFRSESCRTECAVCRILWPSSGDPQGDLLLPAWWDLADLMDPPAWWGRVPMVPTVLMDPMGLTVLHLTWDLSNLSPR